MMGPVTCRDARVLLSSAANGSAVPPSPAWSELLTRQAVGGTPDRPTLSEIGRHVLAELEIRAYRCDDQPLDLLADDLTRVLGELEGTAKNAEYFMTDLGPITPKEAVPYLRIVSVGLANRRETPEDLAERFRQVWGMVEVMGGDARDRLVGAEILTASSAAMSEVYAPMMTTVELLRSFGATRAVASAAILQLEEPRPTGPSAVDRWRSARALVPTDEAAALLATILADPAQSQAFESFRSQFANEPGMGGKTSAALYLASQSVDPSAGVERVLETARLLASRTRRPLLAAALLTAEHPLSPAELVDWVGKAADAAARCQLASQPEEFQALGIALVEGLPKETFAKVPDGRRSVSVLDEAATLLALHAWVYRPLLDPAYEREFTPAPPAATP